MKVICESPSPSIFSSKTSSHILVCTEIERKPTWEPEMPEHTDMRDRPAVLNIIGLKESSYKGLKTRACLHPRKFKTKFCILQSTRTERKHICYGQGWSSREGWRSEFSFFCDNSRTVLHILQYTSIQKYSQCNGQVRASARTRGSSTTSCSTNPHIIPCTRLERSFSPSPKSQALARTEGPSIPSGRINSVILKIADFALSKSRACTAARAAGLSISLPEP